MSSTDGGTPIRVVSVPARHPYVDHLAAVRERSEPSPTSSGPWRTPAALEPGWVDAHADRFDLLHLHFGFESSTAAELVAVVDALRRNGRPLVFTVHDLSNPQLVDQGRHDRQVGLLVESADALLTLTARAAGIIESRWGRCPVVVPHPHVLPLDTPAPSTSSGGDRVVHLHLRDLRPNLDVEVVGAVIDAVALLRAAGRGVRVVVALNRGVRDPDGRDRLRALVAASTFATLVEGERLDDPELHGVLGTADVSVLPYRHGTHSGWLELCWDLGVPVIAPVHGCYGDQHPGDPSVAGVDLLDPAALARRLLRLLDLPQRPGSAARAALVAERRRRRRADRHELAAIHLALYRHVLQRSAGDQRTA